MVNTMCGNRSKSLITMLLVLACFRGVTAHFTLTGSREVLAYGVSDERFWPIDGGSTLRSLKDCLQYPRAAVRQLKPGTTETFTFEIGASASHTGMCTAVLYDAKSQAKLQDLGQQKNCVSQNRRMEVEIPDVSCAACVVKISVAADHRGPTENMEYYDSCVDVAIAGQKSSTGNSAEPEAENKQTKSTTTTSSPTTVNRKPIVAPQPPLDGGLLVLQSTKQETATQPSVGASPPTQIPVAGPSVWAVTPVAPGQGPIPVIGSEQQPPMIEMSSVFSQPFLRRLRTTTLMKSYTNFFSDEFLQLLGLNQSQLGTQQTQKPTPRPTQIQTQKPAQKPSQTPTQTQTQKPTQPPTQKPTTCTLENNGVYMCPKSGPTVGGAALFYTRCVNGNWVRFQVPPGTVCVARGDGGIYFSRGTQSSALAARK